MNTPIRRTWPLLLNMGPLVRLALLQIASWFSTNRDRPRKWPSDWAGMPAFQPAASCLEENAKLHPPTAKDWAHAVQLALLLVGGKIVVDKKVYDVDLSTYRLTSWVTMAMMAYRVFLLAPSLYRQRREHPVLAGIAALSASAFVATFIADILGETPD